MLLLMFYSFYFFHFLKFITLSRSQANQCNKKRLLNLYEKLNEKEWFQRAGTIIDDSVFSFPSDMRIFDEGLNIGVLIKLLMCCNLTMRGRKTRNIPKTFNIFVYFLALLFNVGFTICSAWIFLYISFTIHYHSYSLLESFQNHYLHNYSVFCSEKKH